MKNTASCVIHVCFKNFYNNQKDWKNSYTSSSPQHALLSIYMILAYARFATVFYHKKINALVIKMCMYSSFVIHSSYFELFNKFTFMLGERK